MVMVRRLMTLAGGARGHLARLKSSPGANPEPGALVMVMVRRLMKPLPAVQATSQVSEFSRARIQNQGTGSGDGSGG